MFPTVFRRLNVLKGVFYHHTCRFVMSGSLDHTNSTAGVIIIGDEILKGQVHDTNSYFFSKRLFLLGVKVEKISVIPDKVDEIAKEIAKFSSQYTHVFTAGGIGPTHDDVTFEGVAEAFGDERFHHPELVEACRIFFGTDDLKSPKLKLALIPKSAKLHYGVDKTTGKVNKYPLVSVKNVYIFPGIPTLMERAFLLLEDLFRNPSAEFHTKAIYLNTPESSIADILTEVAQKYKDTVTIGSYPDLHNSYYTVKLQVEAQTENELYKACQELLQKLPSELIVTYDDDPIGNAASQIYQLVNSTVNDEVCSKVKSAIEIVEEALEKYSLSEICVGFNGGKDCTAILHLFYAAVKRKYPEHKEKIHALYIKSKMPFPEVEEFIHKSKQRYNLELIEINGRIKDSLGKLKESHPDIKAVIMGTRSTDPYSNHLKSFSMTDADWPQYMRVSPVLDWNYSQLWTFLRRLNIPYCSLYDRGYTSLGSMDNTHPNPVLKYIDSKGMLCYRPAYTLEDSHLERDGRN